MPCGVTSQMGPTFSVTSMRPSGRKAMRQGRLKVVTWVKVKGRLGSGFCSPALICAHAGTDRAVSSSAVFANFFIAFPFTWRGRLNLSDRYGGIPVSVKSLAILRARKAYPAFRKGGERQP